MKTLIEGFKKGIAFGFGIIFMLVFSVFAYQFNTYNDVVDVGTGSTLTVDMFNQLLANVRDLNTRVGTNKTHYARYYLPTGTNQSIPMGAWTNINFSQKDHDYYNSVTTGTNWNYKAPEAGLYMVTAYVATNTYSWAAGNSYGLGVGINATTGPNYQISYVWVTGAYTNRGDAYGTKIIKVNKDDLISFWFIGWKTGTPINLGTTYNNSTNYVEVTRVGD